MFPTGDDATHEVASKRRPGRGLCERCASFEDAEHVLPPVVILERWALGKRPTQLQVDVALGRSSGVSAIGAKAGWWKG